LGDGEGLGDADGLGEGDGDDLSEGDGDGDGFGEGDGLGEGARLVEEGGFGEGEGAGVGDGAAGTLQSGRQSARLKTNERNFMNGRIRFSCGVTLADGLRVAKIFRMSDHRRAD
jgi:hypothetical protein